MNIIEKKIDGRFSIQIDPSNVGFYIKLKFSLIDKIQNKTVFNESYTKFIMNSSFIQKHLNKSEKDFMNKSKKVIARITTIENIFS
jgi:hypothetical protein